RFLLRAFNKFAKKYKRKKQAHLRLCKRFDVKGDFEFLDRPHCEKHESVAWLDTPAQHLRDAVFVEAMNLHKAFIRAAAKPI
ncbi:MAG TPA: hypothetical protein PLV25_02050, partial [Opitutales bacterium]|nr:hypothetical protein [Opitutales bacterium]